MLDTPRAPLSPRLVSKAFPHTLALAMLLAPAVVFAAPRTFQDLAALVVQLLDSTTAVLVVAGIAVYFWGISTNILKFGEGEMEKLRNYFFWGIIVLFVMVSIWGILHLLQDTLFGSNAFNATNGAPQAPANQFQPPQFLQE
jgi:hypothetical protein